MSRSATRIGFFLISLCITSIAAAQNGRSAISVNGSDSNPCTTVSPCRSFGVALSHTNAGGEVIAVDSGGYGSFIISQSVIVVGAPGVHAALTVASLGGKGIEVTAGSSDSVEIRGLNITITASNGTGILATGFGTLTIEACSVNGGLTGIFILGAAGSHATVVDTAVRGASNQGFRIVSRAALVRCRAENNGQTGLFVVSGTAADGIVSAVDFVSVNNQAGAGAAVLINATAGHNTFLNLDHAMISNNTDDGIFASSSIASTSANVRVTNSTITDNGIFGFAQFGTTSTFNSMNNNLVAGNAVNETSGTISLITTH